MNPWVFAGSFVYLILCRVAAEVHPRAPKHVLVFFTIHTIVVLPIFVARMGTYFAIQVFDCANPHMRDYTWLVLDSLAKGALVDFLESYQINIYRCAPNKASIGTSTMIFGIRMFTTY